MNNEDEGILEGLKTIKNERGHFPKLTELYELGRADLYVAIGGINMFRVLLGEEAIKIPTGYWTEESVLEELKKIKNEISHFPTLKEISAMGRGDLNSAIIRNARFNKFKQLLAVDLIVGYWTDETILEELMRVKGEIGHFPIDKELQIIGRGDLRGGINYNGGINNSKCC